MNKTLLRNKKGWHSFRSQFTGIVFMVPFIIGFVFLFAKPMPAVAFERWYKRYLKRA